MLTRTPPMRPQVQICPLLECEGLAVLDVRCVFPETGWSEEEHNTRYGVVFPRNGVFTRRADGHEMLLDTGVAYFKRPNMLQQIARPHPGDNCCTAIELSDQLAADLMGGTAHLPDVPVFTDGGVDIAQRTLVAGLRSGACGEFEATERAIQLTAQVLELWRPDQVRPGRLSTAQARRRLVDQARELLAADPTSIRLTALARMLNTSPHHLSRVFHEETGQTLARYRNRLRVRLALERIEDGERNLAGLASELGFADHAHLTRTVRREVGSPPAHLYLVLQQPG